MKRTILMLVVFFFSALVFADPPEPFQEMDAGWPKEITSEGTRYAIYQPQLDAWDGYLFSAHAAVAVTEKGAQNPLYGVIAFDALTQVDKTERLVTFENLQINSVRFPSEPDKQEIFRQRLQLRLGDLVRVIALDRVEAGLALLDAREIGAEIPVKNDAPNIVFSYQPAVLIYVDGEPVYETIKDVNYQRVLNTKVLMLRNSQGTLYLRMMQGWLQAKKITGRWEVVNDGPIDIDIAMKNALEHRIHRRRLAQSSRCFL